MSPEAQRIAIAEACPTLVAKHEHGPGYVWNRGPLRPFDPLTDPMAARGMENTLETSGRWIEYVKHLGRLLARDLNAKGVWELNNQRDEDALAHGIGFFIRATPAQRAEAFCRVLHPDKFK